MPSSDLRPFAASLFELDDLRFDVAHGGLSPAQQRLLVTQYVACLTRVRVLEHHLGIPERAQEIAS